MSLQVSEKALDLFKYWVKERESIRRARARGLPPPWTDDPILRENRFCNVSREHDRGTIWIRKNIREPFDQVGDIEGLFKAVVLARFVNLPESLEEVIRAGALKPFGLELDLAARILKERGERGEKIFSPAYMIRADAGTNKVDHVIGLTKEARLPKARTRREFVTQLAGQRGFAEFTAGQVAADLSYTSILRDAPDHYSYSPRGPGAMRGMNVILGRDPYLPIPEEEYLSLGQFQLEVVRGIWPDLDLHLHDVASNCNCEFFKFHRLKHGIKGRRRRYQ